jgi:hypothetical protein
MMVPFQPMHPIIVEFAAGIIPGIVRQTMIVTICDPYKLCPAVIQVAVTSHLHLDK